VSDYAATGRSHRERWSIADRVPFVVFAPFDAFLLKMGIELLYITKTSGKGPPYSMTRTKADPSVSRIFVVLSVCVYLTLSPRPAFAYIDPGAGSMAYQVLLTGLLAGAFAVRRAVTWITGWFRARHAAVEIPDDTQHRA